MPKREASSTARDGRHGQVGFVAQVELDHLAVIHVVDMVAR
jgi:hypothetical protein